MKNNFGTELQTKWDKGNKEHKRPWTKESIDTVGEAQDELLDLFNYCTLMDNEIGDEIAAWARLYWRKLEVDRENSVIQ